jgi:hypothetical protein
MSNLVANPAALPQLSAYVARAKRKRTPADHGTTDPKCSCMPVEAPNVAAPAAKLLDPEAHEDRDLGFVPSIDSAVCSVTASGDYRRPAAACSSASAAPPCGLRFPSKSCSEVPRKDLSGPSVNAELRHLGAGPTRKAPPGVTRTDREIQQMETTSCIRTKSPSSASWVTMQKFATPTTAASPRFR